MDTFALLSKLSVFLTNTNWKQTGFKNVGKSCHDQYKSLDKRILLQMADASAKPFNGLLWLNLYQLGDFDECYNISKSTSSGMVYGKYCLGTLNNFTKVPEAGPIELHVGTCVPSGCTADDIEKIYIGILRFSETMCHSQDTKPALNLGASLTIGILGFFLLVVIASTIWETARKRTNGIVLAFSAFSNVRSLMKSTTNPDQLLCLNGIRAITMMWIILGHVYSLACRGPVAQAVDARTWKEKVSSQIMVNATLAVDSFLAIGGLVTVYTFLKSNTRGGSFNVFLYYLHRYLRLTPSLAVMVLIHATLVPYLGTGPLWSNVDDHLVRSCRDHWWTVLLYTQNYFHDIEPCIPQSWYLSVDFQLFLLSPFILLPLKRWPKVGITILSFLVVLGCIIPFLVGYTYQLPAFAGVPNLSKTSEMIRLYYRQPYTRFGPYVIGMLCGYFICREKQRPRKCFFNSTVVILIWLISITGLIACIFACYHAFLNYNIWSHSLIMAFLRNAWATSLCGVIFICVAGHGGVVDKFLSLPIFQFLSKLSYSMYMVHYSLIIMWYLSMKTEYILTDGLMLWSFWGHFVYTVFFSILLTLMFEAPIIKLEKIIFGYRIYSSPQKTPDI